MKNKALVYTIFTLIIVAGITVSALFLRSQLSQEQLDAWQTRNDPAIVWQPSLTPQPTIQPAPDQSAPIQATVKLPAVKTIPSRGHVFQTFNNCAPATYSMVLQYANITASQKELGDFLRPYQVPKGDNDDKSVSMEEIAQHAREIYNLTAYHRPNGTLEKLKQLIAADQPVVIRTWLNPKEDVGHYIIVRGYNDATQTITFDDSYYNPNRQTSYSQLLALWQPFNYEYLILTKPETAPTIDSILAEETDINLAWQNALERGNQESQANSNNPYPHFNTLRANYYLKNYLEVITTYEQVKAKLPMRMLWYQYEPILAYQKTGDHQKVFHLTESILTNHNRAYSELYYIRAQSYLALNQPDQAKQELELALKYNKNYKQAQDLRASLN